MTKGSKTEHTKMLIDTESYLENLKKRRDKTKARIAADEAKKPKRNTYESPIWRDLKDGVSHHADTFKNIKKIFTKKNDKDS